MNSALRAALLELGYNVQSVTLLSGGMINQAARLKTNNGPLFIKLNTQAPPDLFEREAEGLRALAATKTIRVPEVLHIAPATEETPTFLLLEYIQSSPQSPDFSRRFAEDLAELHQMPSGQQFGWPNDNYLGELSQINTLCESWPRFYRDCRLMPQIETVRKNKLLHQSRESQLQKILETCETTLTDFEPRPSLLHGDLWSGNFLSTGDEAVVIDPATYWGEREMEIAFIELFGGFPADFASTYQQIFPLQKGYERRRPLHQLYPLLIHLNHFGETYGPQLDALCHQILRCND